MIEEVWSNEKDGRHGIFCATCGTVIYARGRGGVDPLVDHIREIPCVFCGGQMLWITSRFQPMNEAELAELRYVYTKERKQRAEAVVVEIEV